jgi:hypothetical protein
MKQIVLDHLLFLLVAIALQAATANGKRNNAKSSKLPTKDYIEMYNDLLQKYLEQGAVVNNLRLIYGDAQRQLALAYPGKEKKVYENLLEEFEKQDAVVRELRKDIMDAQLKLVDAPILSPPVKVSCAAYCGGRGFAAGCAIVDAAVWNKNKKNCLEATPMGLGLLGYNGGPCCTNMTDGPCQIIGDGNETSCSPCSAYNFTEPYWVKKELLFEPLNTTRMWDNTTGTPYCTEINPNSGV